MVTVGSDEMTAAEMTAAPSSVRPARADQRGVVVALLVISAWASLLTWLLTEYSIRWTSPFTWLLVLPMTHLYTGLFITAHDAMHGTVAPARPRLNRALGTVAAFLFAFNWYGRLLPRHHLHHRHVASPDLDPDFHDGHHSHFLPWFGRFAWHYVTVWQVLAMAVTYNLLKLVVPMENLILYWIAPAVLATLQLFYFGTYRPHRGEHAPNNPHFARSQPRQHVWAFLSCYFFGYHYEHHDEPGVPWWLLWKTR